MSLTIAKISDDCIVIYSVEDFGEVDIYIQNEICIISTTNLAARVCVCVCACVRACVHVCVCAKFDQFLPCTLSF